MQRFRIQKNFKTLQLKPRLTTKTRTLGRSDAEIDEHVGSRHWQNDSLEQLLDLLVTAPDVTEFFLWFLVQLHRHYTRVISNVMWARVCSYSYVCMMRYGIFVNGERLNFFKDALVGELLQDEITILVHTD